MLCALALSGCTPSIAKVPDQPSKPSGSGNGGEVTGPGTDTKNADGNLIADGKDADTYSLIRACGYNYETPDNSGNHSSSPFRHITQSWDEELGKHVFNFILHIENDDDRGLANITDRQRNEIKTDNKSPEQMVAYKGDVLSIKWKFKLPKEMQTTTNFGHIHQLKGIDNSSGTADVGQPIVTFTVRSLSNGGQQFQIIQKDNGESSNGYFAKVDLKEFLGEWVSVEETVRFDDKGSYGVVITRIRDGKKLVEINGKECDLWRDGATGIRPKWGLYRSFGSNRSLAGQLRDETLKFADFYTWKL